MPISFRSPYNHRNARGSQACILHAFDTRMRDAGGVPGLIFRIGRVTTVTVVRIHDRSLIGHFVSDFCLSWPIKRNTLEVLDFGHRCLSRIGVLWKLSGAASTRTSHARRARAKTQITALEHNIPNLIQNYGQSRLRKTGLGDFAHHAAPTTCPSTHISFDVALLYVRLWCAQNRGI